MKTVKVNKDELINKLKENRAKHRDVFEAALEGYRGKCYEVLQERIDQLRQGKRINMYFNLSEPQDQTKDYDRALTMLEMSVDDLIEIDERSFQCYVMDDWDWREAFKASNSMYTSLADEY